MCRRILFFIIILFLIACQSKPQLHLNYTKGNAFGTTFSVQFVDKKEIDFSVSYDSLVAVINSSMSTYQEDSVISRVNRGDTTTIVDKYFIEVFAISEKIYTETKGAFDPTIGVLVNAWDFGPEGKIIAMDSLTIERLLVSVGLHKVQVNNNKIIKRHSATYIDFNALAKGYAVDIFAEFLDSKGYTDYLVEIGGEIRGKGTHVIKQKPWKIGVEDPNFDDAQSYSKVVSIHNEAMATSGSYRKYKLDKNGHRYAHIIDPKTGYPQQSNLLSVSVIANNCVEADAYATALMAMGLEKSKKFLDKHPELKGYFIYEDSDKNLQTLSVNGFSRAY